MSSPQPSRSEDEFLTIPVRHERDLLRSPRLRMLDDSEEEYGRALRALAFEIKRQLGRRGRVDVMPSLWTSGDVFRPAPAPMHDEVLQAVAREVDVYLRRRCPLAARRLRAAHAAVLRGDTESFAHAATSCRRALVALADAIFPPREGAVERDRHGRERSVAANAFGNRLLLFLERSIASRSRRSHAVALLDTVLAQVGPLLEGVSKGVHGDLDRGDARRLYAGTVNLIAEIARHER